METKLNVTPLKVTKFIAKEDTIKNIQLVGLSGSLPRPLSAIVLAENNSYVLYGIIGNIGNYSEVLSKFVNGIIISEKEAQEFINSIPEPDIYD